MTQVGEVGRVWEEEINKAGDILVDEIEDSCWFPQTKIMPETVTQWDLVCLVGGLSSLLIYQQERLALIHSTNHPFT